MPTPDVAPSPLGCVLRRARLRIDGTGRSSTHAGSSLLSCVILDKCANRRDESRRWREECLRHMRLVQLVSRNRRYRTLERWVSPPVNRDAIYDDSRRTVTVTGNPASMIYPRLWER